MNQKILIITGILVEIIVIFGAYVILLHRLTPSREQLSEKFSEFKTQYQEKKAQGYDVSEAGELAMKAKRAFDSKDYKMANKFLNEAFEALRRAMKIPTIPDDLKAAARERLSRVKVASFYMTITDGKIFNRSYDDVINILEGVKTDFIFGAFHHWITCPEYCEDILAAPEECINPSQIQQQFRRCEEHGYSFVEFQNAVIKIKAEMPDTIIGVSLPLEFLNPCSRNSITGEILLRNDTWEMALDPSKWGIPVTKKQFQTWWAKRHNWVREEPYNPKEQMPFYFPDPSNPDFQELFLSHAKRLIDAGADAIWIDMLFMPSLLLKQLTGDENHKAVRETFNASSKIVDKIHEYGYSKYGKYIYVGSWGTAATFPYSPPDLDFITGTVDREEILNMEVNETKWEERISFLRERIPTATIFVFFDYGYDNSPMEIFSQNLTPKQQRECLRVFDNFFLKKNIIFVYPVHGPDMGGNIKILSFGKSRCYDSLAPEFQTYETIKELAQEKTEAHETSWITALIAIPHIVSTTLIGIVIGIIDYKLSSRHYFEGSG